MKNFTSKIVDEAITEWNANSGLPENVAVQNYTIFSRVGNKPKKFVWEGEGLSKKLTYYVETPKTSKENSNGKIEIVHSGQIVTGTPEELAAGKGKVISDNNEREVTHYLLKSNMLTPYWRLALFHKTNLKDTSLEVFFENVNQYYEVINEILKREYPYPINWNISDSIFRYCFQAKIQPQWFEWGMEEKNEGQTFLQYLEAQGDEASLRLARIFNTAELMRNQLENSKHENGFQFHEGNLDETLEAVARISEDTEWLRWALQFGEAAIGGFEAEKHKVARIDGSTRHNTDGKRKRIIIFKNALVEFYNNNPSLRTQNEIEVAKLIFKQVKKDNTSEKFPKASKTNIENYLTEVRTNLDFKDEYYTSRNQR